MENPATWTEAEWVVDDALLRWDEQMAQGIFGLSRAMTVTNALRQAGLLKEEKDARHDDKQ